MTEGYNVSLWVFMLPLHGLQAYNTNDKLKIAVRFTLHFVQIVLKIFVQELQCIKMFISFILWFPAL